MALPFERLLTFELLNYTVKLSYLVGILILLYSLILLLKKSLNLTLYRDELWLLFFVLAATLSCFWSIDLKRSLVILSVIIFVVLLFYCLRRLIDEALKEKLISLLIVLGFLISLFALWQFFVDKTALSSLSYLRPQYQSGVFGFPRVQASFLEPLYLANFLLIPIFFNFYRLLKKPSMANYLILTLTGTAFFLTLSRGAFFALLMGILLTAVLIFIYQRGKIVNFFKSSAFILLAGALAVLSIYSVSGGSGLKTYSGHAVVNDIRSGESVVDRKYTMSVALEESLLHPFGIGVGAFGALSEFSGDIANQGYQTVNNLYLEILVETGFLGLILFLIFLLHYALNLSSDFKKDVLWKTICLSLFLAIFIQYLFFSTIYIIYIWAVLAILSPKTKELKNERT